jgi:hypothetical protein
MEQLSVNNSTVDDLSGSLIILNLQAKLVVMKNIYFKRNEGMIILMEPPIFTDVSISLFT